MVLSVRNTRIAEEQKISGLDLPYSVVQDTSGSTNGGSWDLQVFISEIVARAAGVPVGRTTMVNHYFHYSSESRFSEEPRNRVPRKIFFKSRKI